MANVSFYKQDAGATATGAITFRTNGGITVGTGSAATEYASKVSFSSSLTSGTKIGTLTINGTGTNLYCQTNADTKNTAGSSNTSSKIFLVGATSQATNPQTYSHDTAYVGTDGCLYSGSAKTIVYSSSTTSQTVSGGDYATLSGALVQINKTCYLPAGYVPLGPVTASATVVTGTTATVTGYGFTTTDANAGRLYATVRMTAKSSGASTVDGYYASASATVTFNGKFACYK